MGYNYDDVPERPGGAGAEPADEGAPQEKVREVAPAVMGVMEALKAAAERGRSWEREFAGVGEGRFSGEGRVLAEMCETAIAGLEALLAGSFQRVADATDKPKAPPTPSALFRAGFDYGAMAMLYEQIPEDARPERWGEKPPPPPTSDDAWAIVRAQIAHAK